MKGRLKIVLVALVFLGLLSRTTSWLLAAIGSISLFALVILLILSLNAVPRHLRDRSEMVLLTVLLTLFALAYVLSSAITGPSPRAVVAVVQAATVMAAVLTFSIMRWDYRALRMLSLASILLLWTFFAHSMFSREAAFSSIFSHGNTLGSISLGLLALALFDRKRNRLVLAVTAVMFFVLVIRADSRSILLAGVAGTLVFALWPLSSRIPLLHHAIFFGLLLVIGGFVLVYPQLYGTAYGQGLNVATQDLTSGNFYSGRERLWPALIGIIVDAPFGLGASVLPQNVLQQDFSAHNLFLQMGLQIGYLGLLLFGGILWTIWAIYRQGIRSRIARVSGAFFVALLIHQTFEVTLTQNFFAVGLLQWLIISIGISAVLVDSHRYTENSTEGIRGD